MTVSSGLEMAHATHQEAARQAALQRTKPQEITSQDSDLTDQGTAPKRDSLVTIPDFVHQVNVRWQVKPKRYP